MQAKNNNKQSCNSYINCNTALIVKPEKKQKQNTHTQKKTTHFLCPTLIGQHDWSQRQKSKG